MQNGNENNEMFYEKLKEAVDRDDITTFRDGLNELHPYDQAQFFFSQDEETRMKMYRYLSPAEMADLFENVEDEEREAFISEMDPSYAADMLGEMYADDAVDVLNELEAEQVASYLTLMEDESSKEIRELLHYEEETAGSIMTTEFVAIREYETVGQAMSILKKEAPEAETIYYVFVVDEEKRLTGVISLRDLIIADDDTLIKEILNERVVSISVGADQEEAAKIMRDYDFLALPVVDFQNHLLGIITVDDIVDVIDEEASEDYSKFAAMSDVEVNQNPFAAAKKRLPWLIILLFLGMVTATLIGHFQSTLNQVAILAAFIPVISGTSGNSGTQALAVVVRGIATGDFDSLSRFKLFIQEMGTGLIIGAACGLTLSLIVYFLKGELYLGMIVGFSLMCSLFVATLAGAFVPLIMHKLKVDPAVASGPFISTISDLISMMIYFSIATAFMNYLT
ncbi:MAG TPA: magnesium transporter [Bacillales bacterium]|nr:magnesium transporter [Bacillales bacterium]